MLDFTSNEPTIITISLICVVIFNLYVSYEYGYSVK